MLDYLCNSVGLCLCVVRLFCVCDVVCESRAVCCVLCAVRCVLFLCVVCRAWIAVCCVLSNARSPNFNCTCFMKDAHVQMCSKLQCSVAVPAAEISSGAVAKVSAPGIAYYA